MRLALKNDCLPKTGPLFISKLQCLINQGAISSKSKLCFVDDGSVDDTWKAIEELAESSEHVVGLRLSRNRGHQNALLTGLMEARCFCDISISMDCDGQDDIDAVDKMISCYADGFDVVYGVRSSRESDTVFKRVTAESSYRLMQKLGADVVFNHADFRLLSKRALDGLAQFQEVNLFLRGMVPLVGFPATTVEYERAERSAGETHYPFSKMVALAMDGITSLSIRPIRLISAAGVIISILGIIGIIWVIVTALQGDAVAGWASTMSAIGLVGGVQLFSLGVLGEYIGKIYLEVKQRPRFIVAERTGSPRESASAQ